MNLLESLTSILQQNQLTHILTKITADGTVNRNKDNSPMLRRVLNLKLNTVLLGFKDTEKYRVLLISDGSDESWFTNIKNHIVPFLKKNKVP